MPRMRADAAAEQRHEEAPRTDRDTNELAGLKARGATPRP